MTDEGRRFPGVTENLRWAVGLPPQRRPHDRRLRCGQRHTMR